MRLSLLQEIQRRLASLKRRWISCSRDSRMIADQELRTELERIRREYPPEETVPAEEKRRETQGDQQN